MEAKDVELQVIASIKSEEDLADLRLKGLRTEDFNFYPNIFDLFCRHLTEYGSVPSEKILRSYNVDVYPMAYRGADGKEPRRRILKGIEDIPLLHGSRQNIDKFLRLVGRLPA